MLVLLHDADDGALRVIDSCEVYIYSGRGEEALYLLTATPSAMRIPLYRRFNGDLYAESRDHLEERDANDLIAQLYSEGHIDLSSYDAYDASDNQEENPTEHFS